MALGIVGGAAINALLSVLLDRITPEFKAFFKTQKMDGRLLEKLELRMIIVSKVLDDAEQKQFTTLAVENSPVKKWLDKLRNAAYEAEDLLDLIAYEVTAAEIQADHRTAAREIDAAQHNRMEEIVERLGELVDQIVPLGLRDGVRNEAWPQREPTSSLVEESDIFGRDADRDAILKLLEEDGANIGVIPIVGMGGIGKTTLAGLVYESSTRMTPEFEARAWICVSDNYDGLKIKKQLLKQVNESVNCQTLSVEQIDREIKKSLTGKRFLLVLDDMWNESRNDWDNLQKPLKSAKPGSKIIVTTRSEGVASIMRTVKSYQLHTLDHDYCWRLFSRRAFNGGNEDPKLKAIGKKIVSKCKGLPLAIKMLGDLLRLKQQVAEWEDILSSEIWDLEKDEILPALRLSYWHLPSHLKQCFVYCAIFPKDYKIVKEEIIQLWMAEGFLVKPKRGRGKTIVEWGENCLQELVSRSFLLEDNDHYLGSCFLMHDLVNDLAQDLSRDFLIRMDGDKHCECDTRYRYFLFMASKVDNYMILDTIRKARFLRTFWSYNGDGSNELIGETCVNDLQCLRVLRLSFFPMVKLPESIGKLKHIRYLNLEGTRVERLPETMCSLYNLQTVILYYCEELLELPGGFGNLINLHFLDIRKTPKLMEMPPKMGNLKDLRTLSKFSVGKHNGSDLNELGKLQHLEGNLSIDNLENVVGSPKDILKSKELLKELALRWSGNAENTLHEHKLLEGLQPHTSIEKLSIFGYGGTRFADWVGHSSYSNIVSLKLHGCKNCFFFPSLEQLSSLEYLSISMFDAVEEVSMKKPLNSLKTLHIEDMKQWRKWIFGEENDSEQCGSLAKLEDLRINNCPELKCISRCGPTHMIFESLNHLIVDDCSPCLSATNLLATLNFKQLVVERKPPKGPFVKSYEDPLVTLTQLPSAMYQLYINNLRVEGLEEMGPAWNALENVRIRKSESVECIPLEVFPVLKKLKVERCDNLKSLSACGDHLPHPSTSLISLKIRKCMSLTCFPKGGISAPNLTILQLWYCSSLKSLPEGMHLLLPSLEILSIIYCKEVESFPKGGFPTKLKSLEIIKCDKLICSRLQWGMQGFIALSHLTLARYKGDDLDSFPEESLLPSTLSSLKIASFKNLQGINYKGLQHLTSLSELHILSCPNLQCLPEQGLPSSLSLLTIRGCPFLEERWEDGIGEDWPKISHVTNIEINRLMIKGSFHGFAKTGLVK